MTPGAFVDAICACLGGGLDASGKARWLSARAAGDPRTRLERVMQGGGVFVLAEAASYVDGQVAS